MRRLLLTVVVTLVLFGCSNDSSSEGSAGTTTSTAAGIDLDGAEVALRDQFKRLANGQYGPLWDSLHPAQQALIARSDFINCYRRQATSFKLSSLEIKSRYTEVAKVPGTDSEVETVALTASYETRAGATDTATFHEVDVNGSWRWAMSDPTVCT